MANRSPLYVVGEVAGLVLLHWLLPADDFSVCVCDFVSFVSVNVACENVIVQTFVHNVTIFMVHDCKHGTPGTWRHC